MFNASGNLSPWQTHFGYVIVMPWGFIKSSMLSEMAISRCWNANKENDINKAKYERVTDEIWWNKTWRPIIFGTNMPNARSCSHQHVLTSLGLYVGFNDQKNTSFLTTYNGMNIGWKAWSAACASDMVFYNRLVDCGIKHMLASSTFTRTKVTHIKQKRLTYFLLSHI